MTSPTPWTIDRCGETPCGKILIRDAEGADVAELYFDHKDRAKAEANARLIVAAAEFRTYVQETHNSLNCICHFALQGFTEQPCRKCQAAALLAKVEGHS